MKDDKIVGTGDNAPIVADPHESEFNFITMPPKKFDLNWLFDLFEGSACYRGS